jgi:hypothetical protein
VPNPILDPIVGRARRRRKGRVGAAVLAILVCAASVLTAAIAVGRDPAPAGRVDPQLLTRVVPEPGRSPTPTPMARSTHPSIVEAIPDFAAPELSFGPRPRPDMLQPLGVIVVPTPTPRPRPPTPTHRVSGVASWYCKDGVSDCHNAYSGGMYAAAGPALRVGEWRGRSVRVCGGGSCVTVKLIDWCQCYGSRVIDLYSEPFSRLSPLSAGTTNVTVSW